MEGTPPNEVQKPLVKVFAVDSDLYRGRGFMRPVGFAERPALEAAGVDTVVVAGVVEWNLFDVEPLEPVLEYLEGVERPPGEGRASS